MVQDSSRAKLSKKYWSLGDNANEVEGDGEDKVEEDEFHVVFIEVAQDHDRENADVDQSVIEVVLVEANYQFQGKQENSQDESPF